jgi:hypothetical protein
VYPPIETDALKRETPVIEREPPMKADWLTVRLPVSEAAPDEFTSPTEAAFNSPSTLRLLPRRAKLRTERELASDVDLTTLKAVKEAKEASANPETALPTHKEFFTVRAFPKVATPNTLSKSLNVASSATDKVAWLEIAPITERESKNAADLITVKEEPISTFPETSMLGPWSRTELRALKRSFATREPKVDKLEPTMSSAATESWPPSWLPPVALRHPAALNESDVDRAEVNTAQLSEDKPEPRRPMPNTETDCISNTSLAAERLDPKWVPWTTEREYTEPQLTPPYTDSDEPRRAKLRADSELSA